MQAARQEIFTHPWLDRLNAEPDKAVDALLRGVASLPGGQRASQSDSLISLLGDFPPNAPERDKADRALHAWLKRRREAPEILLSRPGGTRRFIDETAEAVRAAWRLELPQCCAWLQDNLFDLMRWADNFSLDAAFDLGESLLTAAAHLQDGNGLRFFWREQCKQAALQRFRHRIHAVLGGLSRMPTLKGNGISDAAISGLAVWAAALPSQDQLKGQVVREWKALKAVFPHQPSYWRNRWEDICEASDQSRHPFVQWLKEGDAALREPVRKTLKAGAPKLPPYKTVQDYVERIKRDGLSVELWREVRATLLQMENYADLTGESYYLVTSCTNIATHILPHAPGHALALSRKALLWAPSDGHAWSVRASALDALGRSDLAEAVLWEGLRRVPSNLAFASQLAERQYRAGRHLVAEQLLRRSLSLGEMKDLSYQVVLYSLANLLIARGRRDEAAALKDKYVTLFNHDKRISTLERLLAAEDAGAREAHQHFMTKEYKVEVSSQWLGGLLDSSVAAEENEGRRLTCLARITHSDLLLGLSDEAERQRGISLVDQAIADNSDDAYANLVKALGVPEYREVLSRGRFEGSLPVQLAAGNSDWQGLSARFSEGRPLIDLVRLARGDADEGVRRSLQSWTEVPARWDDGWGRLLKERLKAYLNDDASELDLRRLEHDALIQAADVGWLGMSDISDAA